MACFIETRTNRARRSKDHTNSSDKSLATDSPFLVGFAEISGN